MVKTAVVDFSETQSQRRKHTLIQNQTWSSCTNRAQCISISRKSSWFIKLNTASDPVFHTYKKTLPCWFYRSIDWYFVIFWPTWPRWPAPSPLEVTWYTYDMELDWQMRSAVSQFKRTSLPCSTLSLVDFISISQPDLHHHLWKSAGIHIKLHWQMHSAVSQLKKKQLLHHMDSHTLS